MSYKNSSAYSNTGISDYYLDLMVNRSIPKLSDDTIFTITETYNMRPDLLAYDVYGDADLWWVFAQRNPDTLKNPLIDFKPGTDIFVPQIATLRTVLGI